MIFTDTHTHLYSEQFDKDRNAAIQRAIDAGVQRFFIPAIDSEYTAGMHQLKIDFPEQIFLMSGLHPTHVGDNYEQELAHVQEELAAGKYVAVGEIGVDLYWDKTYREQQMDAFARQIQWARDYDLPFAIHCRDAFDEVFEVLDSFRFRESENKKHKGIFHCFTGSLEQARRAVDLGLHLGIGGVATFKNGKIDKFLHEISLEHIVLETDAPYLAPVPYRGKRNESAYIPLVAEKLATIYNESLQHIADVTTENSKRIFGI